MDASRLFIKQADIELEIANMKLDGAETIRATKVKGFGLSADGSHEILSKAPVLLFLDDYKGQGKILIFTLSGAGKANLTIVEPVLKLTINVKSRTKNAQVYLDVFSTTLDLKITIFLMVINI